MKKGLLIIYAGPSGVGKGTLLKELKNDPKMKIAFSVSMTTRKPRPGEIDGKDYFFVSKKRFEQAVKNKELLEHAEYVNNCYGTPKSYVGQKRSEGFNVVLEIEKRGAKQVKKKYGDDAIGIYIVPPSVEDLRQRLIHRGTETIEVINKRVTKAKRELKDLSYFDYVVTNDKVDKAVKEIKKIIRQEMKKTK